MYSWTDNNGFVQNCLELVMLEYEHVLWLSIRKPHSLKENESKMTVDKM